MEIIPYSIHLPALICLVLFAAYRPSSFPLVITLMYAAFFHITSLFESYSVIHQIIIQSTLASMLLTVCITCGENVRYASRFCLCLFLGIINVMLMYSTRNLENGYYIASQVSTASFTFLLNIAEFYCLLRMSHGARGNRIDTVIIDWCLSSGRNLIPSKKAIQIHYFKTKD